MTPRELAAVLCRPFGSGSVLPEPSSDQVYEGRLQGENFLDRGESAPLRLYHPAGTDAAVQVQEWAPWCEKCQVTPPDGPWTLYAAEHLARQHDAVHHGGKWTAEARPAAEVTRLAAGGAR